MKILMIITLIIACASEYSDPDILWEHKNTTEKTTFDKIKDKKSIEKELKVLVKKVKELYNSKTGEDDKNISREKKNETH